MGKHKPIKAGDEFTAKCGTVLTVTEYVNSNHVEVADSQGNVRTVTAWDLRVPLKWKNKDGSLNKSKLTSPKVRRKQRRKLKELGRSVPSGYYVYITTVGGEVVYVGSGKGTRYLHTISGRSGNKELNRLYFSNAPMVTELVAHGLNKREALDLEKKLTLRYLPKCNERLPKSSGTFAESTKFS